MITGFEILIENFSNTAMVDDPSEAVIRILRELANNIEANGIEPYIGNSPIKDINGNNVGTMSIGADD